MDWSRLAPVNIPFRATELIMRMCPITLSLISTLVLSCSLYESRRKARARPVQCRNAVKAERAELSQPLSDLVIAELTCPDIAVFWPLP
jgi:hypothetical protein